MKYVKGGKKIEDWKKGVTQTLADAEALMRSIDQGKYPDSPFNSNLTQKDAEQVINKAKSDTLTHKKVKNNKK